MKKLVDVRAFCIAIAIVAMISLIATKWFGANFWLTFVLVAVGMFVNGVIATIEDERPGGFNNPTPENRSTDKAASPSPEKKK